MDKAALVSVDIENGAQVLAALDKASLKVNVAALVLLSEYEDWRLLLASRTFDTAGVLGAYRLAHQALDGAGFPVEKQPSLLILRITDPSIRELRRIFAKTKSVAGMRLGGQMIGDRFIEDGYAYRIS
jgi:hypothetical protein